MDRPGSTSITSPGASSPIFIWNQLDYSPATRSCERSGFGPIANVHVFRPNHSLAIGAGSPINLVDLLDLVGIIEGEPSGPVVEIH